MKILTVARSTIMVTAGFIAFYGTVVFALCFFDSQEPTLLQKLTGNRITPGGWGQTLLRFRELENVRGLDILCVGSSHAYRGFDPRIFRARGYVAFNMGSCAQTPMNTYFLLKRHLPGIKPKLVIFELFPVVVSGDGLESTLDLLANSPPSREMLEMALAAGNPHAVNYFLQRLVRFRKHPLSGLIQSDIEDETYIPGGYVETAMVRGRRTGETAHDIRMSRGQLRYFSKILGLVKKSNTRLVVVIQPLPEDYLRSISNYKTAVGELRRIARRHGVEILDFNEVIRLDPMLDYKDENHLNKSGVLKFNKALLDTLESMRVLTLPSGQFPNRTGLPASMDHAKLQPAWAGGCGPVWAGRFR
jgi:hypothetical protein